MPYPEPDDLFEIICNLVSLYPREYQVAMEERARAYLGKEADATQRTTIAVILSALRAETPTDAMSLSLV